MSLSRRQLQRFGRRTRRRRGAVVSRPCSLLSETEVRGYLANDALGNPLLPPGYGIHCPDAVGKRVSNGVVKAEKEEKAARKIAQEAARAAAKKGANVDPDTADKAAQAVLAACYDLQLPPGVVRQHRHKTAAIMSPHELAMVGGEVELTQLLKDAEAAGSKLEAAAWRHEGVARLSLGNCRQQKTPRIAPLPV